MNKLPEDIINHWPEVLSDINVYAIPVEYLDSVHVTFDDENTWAISFSENVGDSFDLESELHELFEEYNDVITKIDFRLDIEKVKKDVQKRTAYFLKKRK